jgi:hypothetical protein
VSIVSETLKKLEKKREPKKDPGGNTQGTRKKTKTFKLFLLASLVFVPLVAWLIFFLNQNTLERQLGPDFKETQFIENVEAIVQPVDKPENEKIVAEEEIIKEVKVDKILDENKVSTLEDVDTPPDMELGGIVTGQGNPYAIINGKIVRQGSKIDGAEIISIEDNSVTYLFNDKEYTLEIR